MQEANTISIKIYTPAGYSGYACIPFVDGVLPQAVDIDRRLQEAGYLLTAPGLAAGEELETITHVIMRIQHNKKDGTQTPCIGMYYENPKLVYCKKAYLNTPEDIATFERLSGLTLAQLPKFPGQFPKRDDLSATEFIIPAKTPFQIRMVDGTYTDDSTGEVKPTKVFGGFYDVGTPTATTGNAQGSTPANVTTLPPQANASGSNGNPTTVDEKAWRKCVMELTAFLYNDSELNYNEFEHTASIVKRMKDTSTMGINPSMSPESAATTVLAYRATKDLQLTTTEFPQAFNGKSLGALLKTYDDFSAGLDDAWVMLVDHAYRKNNPAANQ